jgi:hypothetical protein
MKLKIKNMKKLLLSFFIIGSCLIAKSQVLQLYTMNDVLINSGDTISVDSLYTVSEIESLVKVKNVSGSAVSVKCRKQYVSIITGSLNTFCWAGNCYSPTQMAPNNTQLINPSEINTGFSGHYSPNGNIGTSIIRYVFYTTAGDSAKVVVSYNAKTTLGVNDNSIVSSMSTPYPNPAVNSVNINYSIANNAKVVLQVYNICGKMEKQYSLNDTFGVASVNVSDLPSGIYFCSFNVNGRILDTKRFVITH